MSVKPPVTVKAGHAERVLMKRIVGSSSKAKKPKTKELVKAVKSVKKINKMMKSELRYQDVNTSAAITTSGSIAFCNLTTPGDATLGTREGQQIVLERMEIKAHFYSVNSTVANVRLMVVYDRQPNAATFLVNDVLSSTDPNAMRAYNGLKRFIILYDKSFSISSTNTFPKRIDKNISLRKLITNYNTTNGGTIADIVSGSLSVVTMSDITVGSGNGPTCDLHTRTWYDP